MLEFESTVTATNNHMQPQSSQIPVINSRRKANEDLTTDIDLGDNIINDPAPSSQVDNNIPKKTCQCR